MIFDATEAWWLVPLYLGVFLFVWGWGLVARAVETERAKEAQPLIPEGIEGAGRHT